jgi:hypothetical protein
MAERDRIRREAIFLAQEETARRNAEIEEYQELRMQSIREYQESQLVEQRNEFEARQKVAHAKMEIMEKKKLVEFEKREIMEKLKNEERENIFHQMQRRLEDRRESFLQAQAEHEHLLELTRKRLERERVLAKESLVLIAKEKQEQVKRAKLVEEYQRNIARDRLAERDATHKKVEEQKVCAAIIICTWMCTDSICFAA